MTDHDTGTSGGVPPWVAGTEGRMHELNPELTEAQITIVAGYGKEISFSAGEWLWQTGERGAGFFLILDGEVDIVSSRDGQERVIITHGRDRRRRKFRGAGCNFSLRPCALRSHHDPG